jgi:protein-tyrosine phosphatase
MPSVLFVCTGNVYRSPLAAAFFFKQLQQTSQDAGWRIESAGTWVIPGQKVPNDAQEIAARFKVDLSRHIRRSVSRELLESFDLILVMEKGHKEALRFEFPSISNKVHMLSEVVDHLVYDIPDPAVPNSNLNEIANELFKLIERGHRSIVELAQITQNQTHETQS